MAKELDLSGVDDILAEDKQENELDLSGVDDVLSEQEPSMVQNAVETVKQPAGDIYDTLADAGKGFVQGSTFGAGDEIAGAGMTALEKVLGFIPGTDANKAKQVDEQLRSQGFQIPEESLADTYAGYQQTSEDVFNEAEARSPFAYGAGNVAGNIATGIAGGKALEVFGAAKKAAAPISQVAQNQGKLKAGLELLKGNATTGTKWLDVPAKALGNYAKAAPLMAAEGVVGSKEQLVGQNANPEGVLEDVGSNLAFGVPAILGMQGISDVAVPAAKQGLKAGIQKAEDIIGDTPFARKAKQAFEFGEQGINPVSEQSKKDLLMQQQGNAQGLLGEIMATDKQLGTAVNASLDAAEQAGQIINVAQPVNKAISALNYSYQTFQDMADNSRGRQILDKISQNMADVTPTEAKAVLDDIDAFIGKFNAARNRTTTEEAILNTLQKTRKELSNSMKAQIPEYKAAADRFFQFRSMVPETILAGERPADVADIFMGDLRNAEKNLYDRLNTMSIESSGQGSGVENVIKSTQNTLKGMKDFEAAEAARGVQSALKSTSDEFGKKVQKYSDTAQMLRDMQTVKSPHITSKNLVAGLAEFGHGGALASANVAGRLKKPITNISKKVYNMPAEKLSTYAQKLQTIPGLERYGKALQDGLANGDQAKKNAALFSLMQNPQARIVFGSDDEEGM